MKFFKIDIGLVTRIGQIAFLSLLLLGCADSDVKRIAVWTGLRPIEHDYLQTKLDEFAPRYPEYEFVRLRFEPEELRTNFMISALAGKGPGLVHLPSDQIAPLAELAVIKPMEEYFSQAFLDSFLSEPVAANTWFDGHLYQIADRVGNHLGLVYNRDLVPDPPESMNELIEMGKELARDEDGDGWPDQYAITWNFTEPFFAVPFIGFYGGWIVNENKEPTLNTPAVRQAGQLIYDLANKHRIMPRDCNYETANALFMDGRSAMIINGPWSWGTYVKAGMNIGLTRIPKNDETGEWAKPLVSPLGYAMNVNLEGEELEITLELLRFLTSEATQLKYCSEFNLIPARKSLFEHEDLASDALYQSAVDQLMVGREMPVITELRWIWDGMRPAYQGIFTGHYTAEEAAAEMQRNSEQLIRENRQ